jgi:hypothetical protein
MSSGRARNARAGGLRARRATGALTGGKDDGCCPLRVRRLADGVTSSLDRDARERLEVQGARGMVQEIIELLL